MSGLGLTPNEIVGYRLRPDWYSWNVVLVKRHGASSKNAGQEYETTLAYCKNLEFAVSWMFNHAVRTKGERNQVDEHAVSGSLAAAQSVLDAVVPARDEVLRAIAELQSSLTAAGLRNKDAIKMLGGAASEEKQAA